MINNDKLAELALELPVSESDCESLIRMRSAVMEGISSVRQTPASSSVSKQWRTAAGVAAVAACVVVGALWVGVLDGLHTDGVADEQGSWAILADGTMRYEHLASLGDIEPMRIWVGDAVVLSEGASFEVYIEAARLQNLFVLEGQLDVVLVDMGRISLQAGQTLRVSAHSKSIEIFSYADGITAEAPMPITPDSTSATPEPLETTTNSSRENDSLQRVLRKPQIPRRRKKLREGLVTPPTDIPPEKQIKVSEVSVVESSFELGFKAFQDGRFSEALEKFDFVLRDAPRSALSRDARYWSALALVNDGRQGEAIDVMQRYVILYPASGRTGEIYARLGWLLLDSGKKDEARASFESASQDSRSRVRTNAQAGLQELLR